MGRVSTKPITLYLLVMLAGTFPAFLFGQPELTFQYAPAAYPDAPFEDPENLFPPGPVSASDYRAEATLHLASGEATVARGPRALAERDGRYYQRVVWASLALFGAVYAAGLRTWFGAGLDLNSLLVVHVWALIWVVSALAAGSQWLPRDTQDILGRAFGGMVFGLSMLTPFVALPCLFLFPADAALADRQVGGGLVLKWAVRAAVKVFKIGAVVGVVVLGVVKILAAVLR